MILKHVPVVSHSNHCFYNQMVISELLFVQLYMLVEKCVSFAAQFLTSTQTKTLHTAFQCRYMEGPTWTPTQNPVKVTII